MSPQDIDEDFLASLFGEDELGVVVRAHIHIEAQLNELLRHLVPEPSFLPRLRFEQRVNLAVALGLFEAALGPLKKLGDIRNAFGHKLKVSLTREMVDDLWSTFTPEHKAIVLGAHEAARKALPDKRLPDFDQLGPRDKFISIAVSLDKMLLSSQLEAKRNTSAA
jgi:hypothetical protein